MKVRERQKANNAQRRLVGMPMLHLDGPSCQKGNNDDDDDDDKKVSVSVKRPAERQDEPRKRRLGGMF